MSETKSFVSREPHRISIKTASIHQICNRTNIQKQKGDIN